VAVLFTKFDPRAFFDDERNASAAAAEEEPTLATLAGLAGCKTHSEKSERDTVFIRDVPGSNARAEDAAAKAAKAAKPGKIEPLFELLRPANGGWIAEDWRTRFAERASAAEHHRGISHAEAALWAFETVVIEWLTANPSPSPAGRCTWCGQVRNAGCCSPAVRHRNGDARMAARRMLARVLRTAAPRLIASSNHLDPIGRAA
jgi:hypothetical protein